MDPASVELTGVLKTKRVVTFGQRTERQRAVSDVIAGLKGDIGPIGRLIAQPIPDHGVNSVVQLRIPVLVRVGMSERELPMAKAQHAGWVERVGRTITPVDNNLFRR